MLRKKALRKIFITSLSVFILTVVYLIPYTSEKVKEVGLEVEYTTGMYTNTIYLLNNDNLLVKSKILLDKKTTIEKVKQIVDTLTNNKTNFIPAGLSSLLNKDVVLKDVKVYEDIVHLNFNKNFLNLKKDKTEKTIESLLFSITDLDGINGICIKIEDKVLEELNGIKLSPVLTRKFGVNKSYDIKDRNNIDKVVLYYLTKIEDNTYYVPITKYINNKEDKIEVIIKNLTSNYIYEPNLISVLNQNAKLLNYEINSDMVILNFDDSIYTKNKEIAEEVFYTLGYSIYDNYNIKTVVYKVNGKEIEKKSIKELE